jgi:hypothetical protein
MRYQNGWRSVRKGIPAEGAKPKPVTVGGEHAKIVRLTTKQAVSRQTEMTKDAKNLIVGLDIGTSKWWPWWPR